MREYHARLQILLDRSSAAVSENAVKNVELAGLRWQLVRLLREYQLFKHVEVFDPLIKSNGSSQCANARDMKERCEIIGDQYNGFIKAWNLGDNGPSSADYRAAATKVLAAVRRHVASESEQIPRLLNGLGELR